VGSLLPQRRVLALRWQLGLPFGALALVVLAVSLPWLNALRSANADFAFFVHESLLQEQLAIEVRASANQRAATRH
jgi:hypothetical protein